MSVLWCGARREDGKQVPMGITLNKKREWRQARNHTAKVLREW